VSLPLKLFLALVVIVCIYMFGYAVYGGLKLSFDLPRRDDDDEDEDDEGDASATDDEDADVAETEGGDGDEGSDGESVDRDALVKALKGMSAEERKALLEDADDDDASA